MTATLIVIGVLGALWGLGILVEIIETRDGRKR